MQFLRTLDGTIIPETHVVQISRRHEPDKTTFGDKINVPHHYVIATTSLRPNLDSLSNREYVVSANEVARFIKASEAPNAPAQRQISAVQS